VVASPVGINAELVRHGETGFLAGDAPAWREALEMLATDRALRARMGVAGRARILRHYSHSAYVAAYVSILEGLRGRVREGQGRGE
jgi:glycosyltransferase involved in cell wall biosynthesis